jgi:hypothetical protein
MLKGTTHRDKATLLAQAVPIGFFIFQDTFATHIDHIAPAIGLQFGIAQSAAARNGHSPTRRARETKFGDLFKGIVQHRTKIGFNQ